MIEHSPSATALRVATRRAEHQVLDDPLVFPDPLALRILGVEDVEAFRSDPSRVQQSGFRVALRAFLVVRSRFAEDEILRAVEGGVGQVVVLGAGLDTFAYRHGFPEGRVRIFEVDHPATQGWKREVLDRAGIPVPASLTFAPVDFEHQTLGEGLGLAGFDASRSAIFSWLGVAQYLSNEAVLATLRFVGSLPAGSGIIFDYSVSPDLLSPRARAAYDKLAWHVAQSGEPFRAHFDPAKLMADLGNMGFSDVRDYGAGDLNTLYFEGRSDRLKAGGFTHLMMAVRG